MTRICKTTFDNEWIATVSWSWICDLPAKDSICYLFSPGYKIYATANIDDLLPVSNSDNIDVETYIEKTKNGFRITNQNSYDLCPSFSSLLERVEL